MHDVFFDPIEHRYFLDKARTREVPSVSRLLEHFGYANFDHVDPAVLKAAQEYGKVVHETLALRDRGALQAFDPQIAGEISAWSRFIDDYKIKFSIIEKPLVSKTWGFAGTPDRYGDGILVDIKTCNVSVSHAIQTAMYQILIEEALKEKVKKRFTVHIKNGAYKIVEHKDRNDILIAKSSLQIYHFKNKKGLLKG